MHPVLDVLADRRARGDRPGARGDDRRVVLSVEGGGSRATLSGGMVMALEELGLTHAFDAVYGASAGTINGLWFVIGEAHRGIPAWYRPGVMTRVTALARMVRGQPLVDMKWVVDELYRDTVPLDWEAVRAAEVPLHPMATDADDGSSVDLRDHVTDVDTLKRAVRASTHLPVLGGPPIELGGRRYLDAALAETLPFRTPLEHGATEVLLLRTRREDDPAKPPWRSGNLLARAVLSVGAPGAALAWRTRYERQLADDAWLAGPGRDTVLAVHPQAGTAHVGQRETDPDLLRQAVEDGRTAVRAAFASLTPGPPSPSTEG